MSTKGQITFSPGDPLLEWLDAQAKQWGIKRATVIKIILTSHSERYPDGQERTPAQEKKP